MNEKTWTNNRPKSQMVPNKTLTVFGLFLLFYATCLSQVVVSVSVERLQGITNPTTTNLKQSLEESAKAGISEWTKFLEISGPRHIEVIVRFNPTQFRGSGRSLTTAFVRKIGNYNLFEQAVAKELRDGKDTNGSEYDVEFNFDPKYLRDIIWFDPDPSKRIAQVPKDRLDSVTFFAHEFGHALAFNGWINPETGILPSNSRSTWDYYTRFDGKNWTFIGPTSLKLYGNPIPLSRVQNNYHHYGNPKDSGAPGTSEIFLNGLMNGVLFEHGKRYHVSMVDIALIKDCGVKVRDGLKFNRIAFNEN